MKKTIIKVIKELKVALIVWLFFILICFISCYILRDWIYSIITKPITSVFGKNYNSLFIYTSIFESFTADLLLSFYSSLLLSIPILLICCYWFFAKSLYQFEKKILRFILSLSLILTIMSMFFVYCFLLPHFVVFFTSNVNNATPMFKIIDYVITFFHLFLIVSLLFQFPVIIILLIKFGILKKKILKKYRKHSIVIIFVISAIVTPPDVLSQIVIALLLILVYEVTIFCTKNDVKKNKNRCLKDII